jgi:hypothetical protein
LVFRDHCVRYVCLTLINLLCVVDHCYAVIVHADVEFQTFASNLFSTSTVMFPSVSQLVFLVLHIYLWQL